MTRVPSVALLTTLLGIRTVLEVHGIPHTRVQHRAMRLLSGMRALRVVVCISHALRRDLEEAFGFNRTTVLVAHDAAPVLPRAIPRDEARKILGLEIDHPVVVYAGSLKADKGVPVLLEALALRPGVMALIAGGAPPSELERLRSQYGEGPALFLGQLPRSQVDIALAAADVIVAPFVEGENLRSTNQRGAKSVSIHQHMSPLKIYEAMRAGRPLISSDMAVLREVLVHELNCILVPPGDPAALRAAIDRLIEDGDLAHRLAEEGRRASEAWTWEARAKVIIDAFADS